MNSQKSIRKREAFQVPPKVSEMHSRYLFQCYIFLLWNPAFQNNEQDQSISGLYHFVETAKIPWIESVVLLNCHFLSSRRRNSNMNAISTWIYVLRSGLLVASKAPTVHRELSYWDRPRLRYQNSISIGAHLAIRLMNYSGPVYACLMQASK